jgi:hypothetical protein
MKLSLMKQPILCALLIVLSMASQRARGREGCSLGRFRREAR